MASGEFPVERHSSQVFRDIKVEPVVEGSAAGREISPVDQDPSGLRIEERERQQLARAGVY